MPPQLPRSPRHPRAKLARWPAATRYPVPSHHRDTHIVDGIDDAFDLLRIDDLGGQVVIDLRIRQIALLLAARNEQLELRLAVLRRTVAAAQVRTDARCGDRHRILVTDRVRPFGRSELFRRRGLGGNRCLLVRLGCFGRCGCRARGWCRSAGVLAMRRRGGTRYGFTGGRSWFVLACHGVFEDVPGLVSDDKSARPIAS